MSELKLKLSLEMDSTKKEKNKAEIDKLNNFKAESSFYLRIASYRFASKNSKGCSAKIDPQGMSRHRAFTQGIVFTCPMQYIVNSDEVTVLFRAFPSRHLNPKIVALLFVGKSIIYCCVKDIFWLDESTTGDILSHLRAF